MTAGSVALLPDSFIPSPAVPYLIFFQAQPRDESLCDTHRNPQKYHLAQLSRVHCSGISLDSKYISIWSNAQEVVFLHFLLPSDWTKARGENNVPYRPVWMPSYAFGCMNPYTDASCQQKPIQIEEGETCAAMI